MKVDEIHEHPLDPLNRYAELYQTWRMSRLANVTDEDEDGPTQWTKLGFSAAGPLDSGLKVQAGDEFDDIDSPNIRFGLENFADDLEVGDSAELELDFYFWESQRRKSTRKVRSLFTNQALKQLFGAWKSQSKDHRKARKELGNWLESNLGDIVETAASSLSTVAGVGGPLVEIASTVDISELVGNLVQLARSQKDRFHGRKRHTIELTRESDQSWTLDVHEDDGQTGASLSVEKGGDGQRGTFQERVLVPNRFDYETMWAYGAET